MGVVHRVIYHDKYKIKKEIGKIKMAGSIKNPAIFLINLKIEVIF